MRGNWGELVLERVLEKSGLVKGSEYEVQQTIKTCLVYTSEAADEEESVEGG